MWLVDFGSHIWVKEDFLLINNLSGVHACGCVRCNQKLEQEKPVHAIQDSRESVSSDWTHYVTHILASKT